MEVAPVFKHMMEATEPVVAEGTFQSVAGKGWLARCYTLLIGIPLRAQKKPFVVEITPHGEHSVWKRLFDGKNFSTQIRQTGNLLQEKKFPAAFHFVLETDAKGGLYYRFRSFRVLGIPLPRFFSVRPEAACEALGATEWSFCVHVYSFGNKLVLKYWGKAVLVR